MIVQTKVISNPISILNKEYKIYHSSWGTIVGCIHHNGALVVMYSNEPNADQEYFSYIVATETDQEIPWLANKEAKYINTIVHNNTILHIYTNTY